MPFRLSHIILWFLACQSITGVWAYEEGLASYYHHRFHGKASSSGRVHDRDELVAAHRTHPFGTFLRVTNLANMKSVIVCVTDRGPRKRTRIVDVSRGAAELLDFVEKGVARVRIEVVPGSLDLRYLDLIYPKIPALKIDYQSPVPPLKFSFDRH
ncbi:MAG: septal ring lytic transglycosylase RlpA family protein [Tannerellaceae bacterium]